jgi:hypothetical protein
VAKLPALNITLAQPTTTSLSTGAVFGRALSAVSADFAAALTAAGGLLENLPNGAAVYPNASAATAAVKVHTLSTLIVPPPTILFPPQGFLFTPRVVRKIGGVTVVFSG